MVSILRQMTTLEIALSVMVIIVLALSFGVYLEASNLHSQLEKQAVAKLSIGEDLEVYDIEVKGADLRGKIRNVSDKPIKRAYLLLIVYRWDGTIDRVLQKLITNLDVDEVSEFTWEEVLREKETFRIIAVSGA